MDPRLEAAAHAGDVNALHQLLQHDKLLLHRPYNTGPFDATDHPIHVAALLGYSEFVREILARNPDLAHALNGQGLSPLYLASANGHLSVVKELLLEMRSNLCLLRDKDGLLPIHTAAVNGRVCILEELMNASPESIRARTCLEDTILHLAVKSNRFEAIKFLVERLDQEGDYEFLMSKDAKGNTVLHLATARKQLEIVKLLLSKSWIDVNVVNSKGSTMLDVLWESPYQHGDLMLGEMIRAAGGRLSAQTHQSHPTPPEIMLPIPNHDERTNKPIWRRMLRLFLKYPLTFVGLGYLVGVQEPDHDEDYYRNAPDTLIVVATLIVAVTFQGGLNPPGGFAQRQDEGESLKIKGLNISDPLIAGQALIADQLSSFVLYDIIALMASLSVILLLICFDSRKKSVIRISMWITWLAVFFVGLAFNEGIFYIFPDNNGDFYRVWIVIICIFIIWLYIRFIVYMLKKARWLKDKKRLQTQEKIGDWGKIGLFAKRFVTIVMIFLAIVVIGSVIWFILWFLK